MIPTYFDRMKTIPCPICKELGHPRTKCPKYDPNYADKFECTHCKNLERKYVGHTVRQCPELKLTMCNRCKETGHTVKYCTNIRSKKSERRGGFSEREYNQNFRNDQDKRNDYDRNDYDRNDYDRNDYNQLKAEWPLVEPKEWPHTNISWENGNNKENGRPSKSEDVVKDTDTNKFVEEHADDAWDE